VWTAGLLRPLLALPDRCHSAFGGGGGGPAGYAGTDQDAHARCTTVTLLGGDPLPVQVMVALTVPDEVTWQLGIPLTVRFMFSPLGPQLRVGYGG